MVSGPPKESVKGENALYIFNRLLRMAAETELSTWKQNQVRNFMRHDQINEILSLTDGFGRTILDNACSAGNLRLVQLLWPAGAKLGKAHVTMAIVCSEEHLPILDYLLAHDASLAQTEVVVGDEEDDTERMPLLNFCARKGDERLIGILMAYSFKTPESLMESLDQAGNTPLHLIRKEKVAAQILNRSGLEILTKTNRRGQIPLDCLLERYSAIPPNASAFPGMAANYEDELKKTIAFLNTLMNHVPAASKAGLHRPARTVTPPTLPRVGDLALPTVPSALLRRQSTTGSNTSASSASRHSPLRLPSRDVKSLLSRDLISNVAARNRHALLHEQRELLKSEVAAFRRHEQHQSMMASLKQQQQQQQQQQGNPLASMLQQQQQQPQPQAPPGSPRSSFRLPLTSSNAPAPGSPNHKRYVAAIDAAFASEHPATSSGVSPSLSLLASALSNHGKSHNSLHLPNKNLLLEEDYRLRAAKSLYSHHPHSPRFQDNELHKLLRAKYC